MNNNLTDSIQNKSEQNNIEDNNNNMSKNDIFWYNVRNYINYYFCLNMLKCEKKVKWDKQLCNVSYTYSSHDYDRKIIDKDTNQDKMRYIMNPIYKYKDIHGKSV